MNKLFDTTVSPDKGATVVSISRIEHDHIALRHIFDRPEWAANMDSKWVLHPVPTLEAALPMSKEVQVPIVVSEGDLEPGTPLYWLDCLPFVTLQI
jgi:hypothetical protein